MEKIFKSFPELSNWEIYSSLIFKFPHVLSFIATVFIIGLTILLIMTTFVIRTNTDQNIGKPEVLSIIFTCFLSFVMISNQVDFPKVVKEDVRGEEELLRIEKIKDWYVGAAPLIDKELSSKEYSYADYKLLKYETLNDKQDIYLNSIGFTSPNIVELTIITEKKKLETIKAFVQVEKNSTDTPIKNGMIELKYTSEFGDELDLGRGLYYGTMYVD